MIRQLPVAEWPMGLERAVAFLALSPEAISARTGLVFASDHDVLDAFRAAVLPLANHAHAALQYYENAPVKGTTVLVDNISMATFREIVTLLRLSPDDVSWVSPIDGVMFQQCIDHYAEVGFADQDIASRAKGFLVG